MRHYFDLLELKNETGQKVIKNDKELDSQYFMRLLDTIFNNDKKTVIAFWEMTIDGNNILVFNKNINLNLN